MSCTSGGAIVFLYVFLSEGFGADVYLRLRSQGEGSVLFQISLLERMLKVKEGLTSVSHKEGNGIPSAFITDDDIGRASELILSDRRVTEDVVTNHFPLSQGIA